MRVSQGVTYMSDLQMKRDAGISVQESASKTAYFLALDILMTFNSKLQVQHYTERSVVPISNSRMVQHSTAAWDGILPKNKNAVWKNFKQETHISPHLESKALYFWINTVFHVLSVTQMHTHAHTLIR